MYCTHFHEFAVERDGIALGSVRATTAALNVPSGENRSHGASLGNKLRRFCNGTRFRYVFG